MSIRYNLPKNVKRVRPPRNGEEVLKENSSSTDSDRGGRLTERSPYHPSSPGYAQSERVAAVSSIDQRPVLRSFSSPDVSLDSKDYDFRNTGRQHQVSHVQYMARSRAGFADNNADLYRLRYPSYEPVGESSGNVDRGPGWSSPNHENPRQRGSVDAYHQPAEFGVSNRDHLPSNDQPLPSPLYRSATKPYDNSSSQIHEYDRSLRDSQMQLRSSTDATNGQGGGQRQLQGGNQYQEQEQLAETTGRIYPEPPHFMDRGSVSPQISTVGKGSTWMTPGIPNYGEVYTPLSPGYQNHRIPVYETHREAGYGFANDSWSIASKTTTTDSMESTSTEPDNIGYSRALGSEHDGNHNITHTRIDLRRSLIRDEHADKQPKKPNPYRCLVMVWQDALSKPGCPSRLDNRRLMLDTQCEDSNWVSESIVKELGAETWILEHPARFITFNGDTMTSNLETTLSFAHMDHGTTKSAKFLVAVAGIVPFDMVLGSTAIEEFKILGPPVFGLRHDKQGEEALKVQADRLSEYERRRLQQDKKNRRRKEDRDKNDKSKRNGESSRPKPEDKRDSGFEYGERG